MVKDLYEQFILPIDEPSKDFERHLNIEFNTRILFSGPFGVGKTHFLKKFFQERQNDFLVIYLAPINYSISSNEDVFKLLKYDILYELLKTHQFNFEALEFSNSIIFQTLILNRLNEIGNSLIEKFIKLNKNIDNVFQVAQTFEKYFLSPINLEKEVENIKTDADEKKVKEFINKLDNHYLLELDFISNFIENALTAISFPNGKLGNKKEKVLIIDDLDRIDPEHVFRLFNVFSAHFDYRMNSENKFGFDRVIFVCDINNIRNIFQSKYGQATDFNGYIDKFYTAEVFEYDNSHEVRKAIRLFANSITFQEKYDNIKYFILSDSLFFILENMVFANALSIRILSRCFKKGYYFRERDLNLGVNETIKNWNCTIILIFEFLKWMMGSGRSLYQALDKTSKYIRIRGESHEKYNIRESSLYKSLIEEVLTFLTYKEHNFSLRYKDKQVLYLNLDNYNIEYVLNAENYKLRRYCVSISTVNGDASLIKDINYFDVLVKTFELYNGGID